MGIWGMDVGSIWSMGVRGMGVWSIWNMGIQGLDVWKTTVYHMQIHQGMGGGFPGLKLGTANSVYVPLSFPLLPYSRGRGSLVSFFTMGHYDNLQYLHIINAFDDNSASRLYMAEELAHYRLNVCISPM